MKQKFCIFRYLNGVTLNSPEYIITWEDSVKGVIYLAYDKKNGKVKIFSSVQNAVKYLNDQTGENKTMEEWDEEGIHIENFEK